MSAPVTKRLDHADEEKDRSDHEACGESGDNQAMLLPAVFGFGPMPAADWRKRKTQGPEVDADQPEDNRNGDDQPGPHPPRQSSLGHLFRMRGPASLPARRACERVGEPPPPASRVPIPSSRLQ